MSHEYLSDEELQKLIMDVELNDMTKAPANLQKKVLDAVDAADKGNRDPFPDVLSPLVPICAPLSGRSGCGGGCGPGEFYGALAAGESGGQRQGMVVFCCPEPQYRFAAENWKDRAFA